MSSERMARTSGGKQRSVTGSMPRRSLSLTAPQISRLIREAVHAGGEIWVTGSGQSMHPTVRHADFVLLSPLARRAKRGDVVLVPLGPGLMLHRVVHVDSAAVVTRGDARQVNDVPVSHDQILARAVAVRRRGVVTPLVATTRFGVAPLLRFFLRATRRRIRLLRARARRAMSKRNYPA